jgi:hypothetical protein
MIIKDDLLKELEEHKKHIAELTAIYQKTELAKNELLRIIQFYADDSNYAILEETGVSIVGMDLGGRARSAIANSIDYTTMSTRDMLDAVRDDASKWATAFCQYAKIQGFDIDEGWMIGWFANAIEHASTIRNERQWTEWSEIELSPDNEIEIRHKSDGQHVEQAKPVEDNPDYDGYNMAEDAKW